MRAECEPMQVRCAPDVSHVQVKHESSVRTLAHKYPGPSEDSLRHICGYSMSVGPQEMRFTIRASFTNMRYAKQTPPAVIYQRLVERGCQASTELHPDFTLLLRILPFVYYNSPSPNEYRGIEPGSYYCKSCARTEYLETRFMVSS